MQATATTKREVITTTTSTVGGSITVTPFPLTHFTISIIKGPERERVEGAVITAIGAFF